MRTASFAGHADADGDGRPDPVGQFDRFGEPAHDLIGPCQSAAGVTAIVTETSAVFTLLDECMKFLMKVLTSEFVLPSTMARRAPSRAAFVTNCPTINPRPNSMMPKTNMRKIGNTSANSTVTAPHRRGADERFDERRSMMTSE